MHQQDMHGLKIAGIGTISLVIMAGISHLAFWSAKVIKRQEIRLTTYRLYV
jgi:hypothetical protein